MVHITCETEEQKREFLRERYFTAAGIPIVYSLLREVLSQEGFCPNKIGRILCVEETKCQSEK